MRTLGLAALAVTPIAWVVFRVARHAVAVPTHDEWQVQVPVAIRSASGTLRPADLLAPHLDHHYVVTRALTAINTWFFGWDLRLELFVNVLLVLVTLLLLVDLARDQRANAVWPMVPLFSLLLFSARQRWLWGLMSASLSVVLLLTAALWTLARRPPSWRPLVAAASLATLATWSAGPGVIVWPALALAAWLAGYRRPAYAAMWAGAFTLVMGALLLGYEHRVGVAGRGSDLARYALAFLGGPLVPENERWMPVAIGLGALGLGVVIAGVWALGRRGGDLRPAAPWLGLCLFSLGTAALAAYARAPLLDAVPFQPLRARYVPLATPFWIGLVALVLLAIDSRGRRPTVARYAWLPLLALAPLYLVANVAAARAPIVPTPEHERCLKAFPRSRDASCLADVVFGVRAVQPRIDDLARLHLATFRE